MRTPPASMPTIDDFRPMVLKVMLDGEPRTSRDIYRDVADEVGLSEEQRAETLSSGQIRHHNRIGWGITSFTKAGALERVARGTYRITDLGREVQQRFGDTPMREADLVGLPMWDRYQQELLERKQARVAEPNPAPTSQSDADPIETIQELVEDLRDVASSELLQRLREGTPEFFERAVIQVLVAMGYGGRERRWIHTGKPGDGGIDGVIPQDPLGINNVYIQAKRYAEGNTVQRSEVQGFLGALGGKGMDRGVFITTSTFSAGARDFAEKQVHGKIVLIDGKRLSDLMLQYGVGVQVKERYEVLEIDEDFFTD